mmetsp:Transcript_17160/g.36864  ORF Transcript_17160/g.36864 Transcript_17160/m.36864 type:complete len:1000 (+) Transcript_17160:91-3090(+)|eukprot:CAMPEP_0206438328 /NCGR_PEP_ID=MMETSP0324_2-20121206/11569_1 /ASSEMBLY_ACC=CAM_ASM_000836 /TAXON_ID=2866 /ORGANISM="Crypthecodinium cohnii, Strain Seligo" /LENGTH=999 /DNA_ID=CAMNT_0053905775 /DNA_START=60 /DNA_END=3059 /DNA_ORIENTATION=+
MKGSQPRDSNVSKATVSTAAPRDSDATWRPSAASSSAVPLLESGCQPEITVSVHTSSQLHSSSNLVVAGTSESIIGEAASGVPAGSADDHMAGLSHAEAARRLEEFGRNEIPEVIEPWYIMLGKQFVGMMPFMLEIAAVLAAVIEDWADFAVITLMLVVNALIGFHEEHKAKQSLDALKASMTATCPTKRDGTMVVLPVAELVPGDIVFLRGGNVVPADCEWLEGDPMLVDTAALTGEPIPRKVPRPEREGEPEGAGRQMLSGCIIKQGEGHCLVKETGLRTEIGQAAGMVQEASGHSMGVFETKIMQVVRAVILVALVDALVVLYISRRFHPEEKLSQSLLNVLALVIGAVPIALPLVMQVTMAIGAAKMAKKEAIVTHLTALQEVASMSVLCSDKTGTLTTADMRVLPSKTWTRKGYSADDALLWAGVASNPANKEDPIDKAILESVHEHFGEKAAKNLDAYSKSKFVGFNPIVKRTVAYCNHPTHGQLKISKGLVDKVLETGDDGGDCWTCADAESIREQLKTVDIRFSTQGYKTVAVAVQKGDGPMEFAAIVPMIDPPREDTKLTIHRIRQAGINVKMITGDHLNIAIETSRLIGLGTGVLPAGDLWPASASRDETIVTADGFAQVLPRDKREVVLVLQNKGLVVGMTGDGVNDAPALAQAQIGIAVDDATEAARSAADMILTSPGLSVIYDAIVESRRIFARLRAYVLYRVAATIQIVCVLSIMIYAYNDTMPALYVILLALLNDVTMLPVADDNAFASALPEIPSMPSIMIASLLYGILETVQTMAFYELQPHWFPAPSGRDPQDYKDATVYLQMSIAVEFLIFSCRTPGLLVASFFSESRPSLPLTMAVLFGNILVSVLAGFGDTFKIIKTTVEWKDIAFIWLFNICGLLVIDFLKWLANIAGTGWMSAGAGGGVLGYPDLPASILEGGQGSHLSTVMHSRSGVRSVLNGSRLSAQSGAAHTPTRQHRRSQSVLPFPHNARAAALNANYASF